jgi:hypothetical protein
MAAIVVMNLVHEASHIVASIFRGEGALRERVPKAFS